MKRPFIRNLIEVSLRLAFCLVLTACSSDLVMPRGTGRSGELSFGPEQSLGDGENNPSTPFLRFAPDGRLFAIWTEDESGEAIKPSSSSAHQHAGKMAPSPLRNALLAASSDGGKTWSTAKIVNTGKEAI